MKAKIAKVSRWILGLMYFAAGLVGLLHLAPEHPMPEGAMAFMNGMMSAPYFFVLLKATETVGGAMLLSGFGAPLALVILAPITIQIFLFHAFLTPGIGNSVMPLVIGALHIAAATGFWHLYRPLFGRQRER